MKTKEKIEELLYQNADDIKMSKVLKEDIAAYFKTLDETFSTSGGKDFLVKHTRKIDGILRLIFKIALYDMFKSYQPMKNTLPIAIAALGSYGREQLCIHSDIDLLIVHRDMPGYNTEKIIEKIFYLIWDCGLKLGHRVHKVDELLEASRSDITIKTAILESRFLEGSHQLWTETQNVLSMIRHDDPHSFMKKRRREQHNLHTKFPLSMEPNLKEGRGGFRDANLVYWIGKVRYNIDNISELPESIVIESEYKIFRHALEFLFRVRSALHLASGKKEDRLHLYLIPEVAKYLGYESDKNSHMKFSQKVLASLRTVYLYTTIWTDLLLKEYGIQDEELLGLPKESYPSEDMKHYLKYLISHATCEYKSSPALLQRLSHTIKPEKLDSEYYQIIRQIFQQPHSYSIVRTLSRARELKHIIQPLQKIIDLPQFDGYHKFPVDAHLISCLYHLENIEDPFIRSLYENLTIERREMLKIVTLLHDAGKGRKMAHSLVGASLFKVFASSLELSEDMIKNGIVLIHNHTLMSDIAQREDLYNEKNIMKFSSQFKTKEMLDLIYILTYADMNGVDIAIYSTFASRLLRALYSKSIDSLEHGEMLNEAAMRVKKEKSLKKYQPFMDLAKSKQKKILSIPSNLLFFHYSHEEILRIAKSAWEVEEFSYKIRNEHFLTIEITSKMSFNLSYILAKLHSFNLVNMDICKLSFEYKFFRLDFNEKILDDELADVARYIEEAFRATETPLLSKIDIKNDEIFIDCNHSKSYALLKLNTRDQQGLMAFLITLFESLQLEIVTAKIHTQKKRTRDLFLMEKNGNLCNNKEEIIEKLTMR